MAEFCTTLNQRISKIAFLLNQKEEKVFLSTFIGKIVPNIFFDRHCSSPHREELLSDLLVKRDRIHLKRLKVGEEETRRLFCTYKEGILWDCPIKRLEFLKKKTKLNTYSAMLWIRIRIPNLLLSWQFNSKLSSYGVSLFLSSFTNFLSSRIIFQKNNWYREQIFLSDSNWVKFMKMDSNILWNNVLKF